MTLTRPSAWIVLACVLVGLPACKKMSPSMASGYPGGEDSYAEESMDYGGDTIESDSEAMPTVSTASMARPMEAERHERKRLFGSRSDKATRKSAPSPPLPAGATVEPSAPSDANPGTAEPAPADEQPPEGDEDRQIIYTAGMRIAVFDLQDALETAEALPERFGGYVQSMSDTQVVLRIPSKSLRPVMAGLAGYGNVERRWLQSQDVTAEFTDIESRLKALEKTHAQLLELLGKARTVEEALKVRQALDRVSSELEVLKGRLRQLSNMTAYSTLTLDFYERGPHNPTPSSNDPFPWVDSLGVESTEWK
ncbi:MAG: DUF4349 domain-containing protein [Nannocystaceae bacterium]|nr:DUF4349 domain-containing protein [Nannocystaceae bacterium]